MDLNIWVFRAHRLTRRVSQTMGSQRNNPQMKGKEEVSERMLNEIEASQQSDMEFKELVIRKLNELTENYQKLQGNYNELTANYINVKKGIKTISKAQEEMKNTISELKNTVEGIKSRLDEAEDRISELEDKVEKKTQNEQEKEKRLRKNEEGLREMQDTRKCNNIHIIRIPQREEEEQGIENLFEKVMMENNPNLMTESHTNPGNTKYTNQEESKEAHFKTHHH